MTKHLVLFASLAACATSPQSSSLDQALTADDCPADVPASLAPAADQNLAFYLPAIGVQEYTCNAAGAWVFVAPDAQLYQPHGDGDAVVHHYAGPTWEWLEDGSTVVGGKLAAFTPDPTAIPWLLLGAVSHGAAEGRMSKVSYIQRLDTVGGIAPSGGCSAGATANVPYTATYYFYVPNDGSDDNGGHADADAQDDSP